MLPLGRKQKPKTIFFSSLITHLIIAKTPPVKIRQEAKTRRTMQEKFSFFHFFFTAPSFITRHAKRPTKEEKFDWIDSF
jgi:hypothetical protein